MTLAELLCGAVVALNMPHSDTACKHMDTVVSSAHENKIKPEVLVAMIHEESRWKPRAVSSSGACGLTQIMPKYTQKPRVTCKQLKRDAELSIRLGAKTLAFWVYEYGDGNYKIGLCGYNSGYRCRGPNRSRRSLAYAARVLRRAKRLSAFVKQKAEMLLILSE